MPIRLIYERGGVSVVLKGYGVVDAMELRRCNEQLYASERVHHLRFQLCDFREVTNFNLSSADMRMLSWQDKAAAIENPDLTIAIVGPEELMLGLARMWEAFVSEALLNANVFRTVEEARAWLLDAERKAPQQAPRGAEIMDESAYGHPGD